MVHSQLDCDLVGLGTVSTVAVVNLKHKTSALNFELVSAPFQTYQI